MDDAGHDRRSSPDQTTNCQSAPWTEFIRYPTATDLKEEVGPGEKRKKIAGLRFRQRYFFPELVRSHRGVDVYPVQVGQEVHQAEQTKNNIRRTEYFCWHGA